MTPESPNEPSVAAIGGSDPVAAVALIARRVAELHAEGDWHGAIDDAAVFTGESGLPVLGPAPERRGIDEENAPLPAGSERLELPADPNEAGRLLHEAGLDVDPVRIDVHQLGALLCRWLTGESVRTWVRSPRVHAGIAAPLRSIVDRALGLDPQTAFTSANELAEALARLDVGGEPPAAPSTDGSDEIRADESTSPSVAPEANTSSPGRSREGVAHPTTLGHYEIVEPIGSGGMGDVYKGYERDLDRHVAIKVLPAEFARHGDFVNRFRAEATAAARLDHPNVVQIHFIGEDAGHHFFAMQFVEGESLAHLLQRRERLSVDQCLPILLQVLAGLGAAHERGLVHRDVKPGNVLLDRASSRALVADFGLVKSPTPGQGLTATGTVMGTVDYISPEQGRGHAVDARADLYSVGVLAYRMLSGRLPFEADSQTAMIFKHVYEEPEPMGSVAPGVPPVLGAIVAKLMQKLPDDRYASAAAVLADLRAVRDGRPLPSGADVLRIDDAGVVVLDGPRTAIVEAPDFGDPEPPLPDDLAEAASTGWGGRLRNRLLDAVADRAPELLNALQSTRQQVDRAVDVYARRERALQRIVDEAESALAELEQQADEWRSAADDARRRAAGDGPEAEEARGEAARGAAQLAEIETQVAAQREQLDEMRLRLARVSSRLTELRGQRDVLNARLEVARARIHLAGGAAPRKRPWWLGPVLWFRWNWWTSATAIVLLCGVTAFVVHRIRHEFANPPDETVEVTPGEEGDGKVTNVGAGPAAAQPIRPTIRRIPLRQFFGHTKAVGAVARSPDGRFLASVEAEGNGDVRVWNASTGELLLTLPPDKSYQADFHDHSEMTLAFSPDSTLLASKFTVWSIPSGEVKVLLPRPLAQRRNQILGFTADNERLFVADDSRNDFTVTEVRTADGSSGKQRLFPNSRMLVGALSPDGSLIAYTDRRFRVHFVDTDTWESRPTEVGSPSAFHLHFSADGTLLALCGFDPMIGICDVATGKLVDSLSNPNGPAMGGRLSPDGRMVAVLSSVRVADDDGRTNDLRVDLWDRRTKQYRAHLRLPNTTRVRALFSADGEHLFVAGGEPFLAQWDASPGPIHESLGRRDGIDHIVAFNGGELLLCSQGREIAIWNPENDFHRKLEEFSQEVASLAVSPDGTLAVVGGIDGALCLYDLESGRIRRSITASLFDTPGRARDTVHSLSFAPDNRNVLVCTYNDLFVWNVIDGGEDYRFDLEEAMPHVAAVSPDGRYAIVDRLKWAGEIGRFVLFDFESGERVREIVGPERRVAAIAFSPDATRLVSGGEDGVVHVSDVETGTRLHEFPVAGKIHSTAFSPDGRHVAATDSKSVRVWEVGSGTEVATLSVGRLENDAIAFFGDGHHLVTANGTGQLWTLGTEP